LKDAAKERDSAIHDREGASSHLAKAHDDLRRQQEKLKAEHEKTLADFAREQQEQLAKRERERDAAVREREQQAALLAQAKESHRKEIETFTHRSSTSIKEKDDAISRLTAMLEDHKHQLRTALAERDD